MRTVMKKILTLVLAMALLLCLCGCGGDEEEYYYDSDSGQISSNTGSQTEPDDDRVAVPDPGRILKNEDVTHTAGVQMELDDGVYTFNQYTYQFQASANLADSSNLMAYQMLLQSEDMVLENTYSETFYKEYAILWNDYFLGFLTTSQSVWELYLLDTVGLNSEPSGGNDLLDDNSSFQNDSFLDGFTGDGFQNESYFDDFTFIPGGSGGASDGPSVMTCEACDGSGRCLGCDGDGWGDNIYYGEKNSFECGVCDGNGVCGVCDGTGQWVFD